jgi:hypothetical protein
MKSCPVTLLLLLLCVTSYAQSERHSFTYKFTVNAAVVPYKGINKKYENAQVDIQANNNYIQIVPTGMGGVFEKTTTSKLIDVKNNVIVYSLNEGREPWYIMEELDKVYNTQADITDLHQTEKINGYTCRKYKKDMPVTDDSYKATYTFYLTDDIKADPRLLKCMLPLLSYDALKGSISGVLVKYDYVITHKSKVISDVVLQLDKVSAEVLKDTDIKLPWKDEAMRPAIQVSESYDYGSVSGSTRTSGITSIWTNESANDYVIRLKALLLKVTGRSVDKFKHVHFASYL